VLFDLIFSTLTEEVVVRLTNDLLCGFVGGQMEIQNSNENYIFRGEIKTIAVVGENLVAKFAWLAKGKGDLPMIEGWVKDDDLDYSINLGICSVNNIGSSDGEIGGGDRICITSPIVGEIIVLYPPNGSKLDPAKVEGLVL
jgi:hypothetical protein